MNRFLRYTFIPALFLLCCDLIAVSAQPSGGHYGPARQTYELPIVSGKVYYVAPDGNGAEPGQSLTNPTSLDSAIARVVSGDAIVIRGGVYRTGNLEVNQGIAIQPYEDEQPVLKGTYVAANWKNLGNGLWVTKWTRLFPDKPADWWQRSTEGKKTPLCKFNDDMVFVDGKFLQSVGWEGGVDENSYYIDYDDSLVYIGIDPTNRLVEITAFNSALIRTTGECHGKQADHEGFVIRGITFTQYAYRALEIEGAEPGKAEDESQFGKDVVGTTLENCTISYCSRVAGFFRGDRLTIRHCMISNTSTEGVYVIASNDILLEGNIFERNNIENITGYYPAAVKIFNQCHRATFRDNLVTDLPNSNGVWYDVGEVDGVFVNNWVENVGHVEKTIPTNQVWPSSNGFFFEISKGAVCAGNVFVNCDHGIMILNSSNVGVYQNTFVNSMACFGRNGRTPAGDRFGWHSSTGPDVDKREGHIFVNNLLTGDENFLRPLLFVWQPASVCGQLAKPELSKFDHNVYVRNANRTEYSLILWSPAQNDTCQVGFDSPESVSKLYPEFESDSRAYTGYSNSVFKSAVLHNYRLLPEFPGVKLGTKLPKDVAAFLEKSGAEETYVGAYPPGPK